MEQRPEPSVLGQKVWVNHNWGEVVRVEESTLVVRFEKDERTTAYAGKLEIEIENFLERCDQLRGEHTTH